jgi:YHS domain-containing protein
MAKSLFQKGADFVSAMVFMFASTNLVLELGIVLVVLIGWQFMAAEFVGGSIMIVLLALSGGIVFSGRALERARRNVVMDAVDAPHDDTAEAAPRLRTQLPSFANWSDAARYTIADLRMLRREMLIGYVVAGFLATLAPTHLWSDAFLRGHGNWTTVENVIVGPFIAVISFVCSIGNVPLAAALWKGGISFGGVVSFIFADLIAMPLLLVYRKLYGTHMTLRMLGVFWAVMSAAGLITEVLFRATGLVPHLRSATIVPDHFAWDPTTFLNISFLALFAGLFALSRRARGADLGETTAIDPVCGMQVQIVNAPATTTHDGVRIYFCSDRCKERFAGEPTRYLAMSVATNDTVPEVVTIGLSSTRRGADSQHHHAPQPPADLGASAIDPVCHMVVDTSAGGPTRRHEKTTYFFCCEGCASAFEAAPEQYLSA